MKTHLFCFLCALFFSFQSFAQLGFSRGNLTYENDAKRMIPLSDGSFLLAGYFSSGWGDSHLFLARYSPYGDTIWTRMFNAATYPGDVIELNDSYLICGYRDNIYVLLKISKTTGELTWGKSFAATQNTFPATYLTLTKALMLPDSSLLLGGNFDGPNGFKDIFLLKTDVDYNINWARMYGNPDDNDWLTDITTTNDSGFIFTGTQGMPYDGVLSESISAVKIDLSGNVIWKKGYNAFGNPYMAKGQSILSLPNNEFLLLGGIARFYPGTTSYAYESSVFIIDSIGSILTNHVFQDSIEGYSSAFNQARIKENGDIICYGISHGNPTIINLTSDLELINGTTLIRNGSTWPLLYDNNIFLNYFETPCFASDSSMFLLFSSFIQSDFGGMHPLMVVPINTDFTNPPVCMNHIDVNFAIQDSIIEFPNLFSDSAVTGAFDTTFTLYDHWGSGATVSFPCFWFMDINEVENRNSEFELFPNPANSEIKTRFDEELKNATLIIFDAAGRKIIENKISGKQSETFNITGFSDGMYFIQLQSEKNSDTKKFIVQH